MSIITKLLIKLFRTVIALFYKYPSSILMFFLLFFTAKAAEKSLTIKGMNYLAFIPLYIAGILLHLIFLKFIKKIWAKLSLSFFIVSAYYITGYYVLKYHFHKKVVFTYILPRILKISNAVRASQGLDYYQLLPLLALFIPLLVVLLLQLDNAGGGSISIIIVSIFMLLAWLNVEDKVVEGYVSAYLLSLTVYFSVIIYTRTMLYVRKNNMDFSVKKNSILRSGVLQSFIVVCLAIAFVKIFGSSSLFQYIENVETRNAKDTGVGRKNAYEISDSGYGTGRLGGPINLDSNVAFKVKSDKPYYLRGRVKYFYDGFSWDSGDTIRIKKSNEIVFSPSLDYLKYMGEEPDKVPSTSNNVQSIKSKRITIYPGTLTTSTLFTPYNSFDVSTGRETIGYTPEETFLLLNKASAKNSYAVDFYESTSGKEDFINNRNNKLLIDYEPQGTAAQIQYYNENIKTVYKDYLELPDNISYDVKNLVDTITKGCGTSSEKVLRIYNYLRDNYQYSLNVSPVPEGKEFLDHFLFVEKKGYCTYFATAAVVFCRIAGLPARYVEGFYMGGEKDSNGIYVVRNDRAHAWCEILISDKYDTWSIVDAVPEAPDIAKQINQKKFESIFVNQWRNQNPDEKNPNNSGDAAGKSNKKNTNMKKNNLILEIATQYSYYLIPVIILMILCGYLLRKVYLLNNLKARLINSDSIIPIYLYSKHRLKTVGIEIDFHKTELEYLQQIRDEDLKKNLSEIVQLYNKEFFGNCSMEYFDSFSYYVFIENYIRQRQNLLKYSLLKYFK